MTPDVQRAVPADLKEILRRFDAVQAWLIARGLVGQWGDALFSASEAQRRRFAAWLAAGDRWVVRRDGQIVGTLVLSPSPPPYARDAVVGRKVSGYLEAFAVHRDYAGVGVGGALLDWAGTEAECED